MRKVSPYTEQAARALRHLVEHELKPGDMLPPERQLAGRLGISRVTLRRLLGELRDEGLIRQHQGRGTFVAESKITLNVSVLMSFSEGIRRTGLVPGAELLAGEVIRATPLVSRMLSLPLHAPVIRLWRKRTASGLVVALEESYFPHQAAPTLLDQDLEHRSVYEILAQTYGIILVRAVQTLEAVAAGQQDAAILEVPPRMPLLRITRVAYDANDTPVEFARDLYRSDRSQFLSETSLNP